MTKFDSKLIFITNPIALLLAGVLCPLAIPVIALWGGYLFVKQVKYAFTPYEDPFEEFLGPDPRIKGRTLADRKAGRWKPS